MPLRRRWISPIAIAVLLIAACDPAPRPTASPLAVASPVPTASPAASPTASARPLPTLPPAAGESCLSADAAFEVPKVLVEFQVGRAADFLGSVKAFGNDGSSAERHEPGRGGVGVLPAGRDLRLHLSFLYGADAIGHGMGSEAIEKIEIRLRLDDGTLVTLDHEAEGGPPLHTDIVLRGMPDRDGRGAIEFDIEWSDRCLDYRATGALPVELHSRETVGSCAVEYGELVAQLRDLFREPLDVADAEARVTASSIDAAYSSQSLVGDAYPLAPSALSLFDPVVRAARVAPGASVRIAAGDGALGLGLPADADVAWYGRASTIEWLAVGGPVGAGDVPIALFWSRPSPAADGTFTLVAPDEPGRYVLPLTLPFESGCYAGTAIAAAGVDVEER